MTKLTMVDLDVLCVDMGASSTIPLLHTVNTRTDPPRSVLGEDDELYLEYRFVKSASSGPGQLYKGIKPGQAARGCAGE